jgi:soluble lytic murein transglycosylase
MHSDQRCRLFIRSYPKGASAYIKTYGTIIDQASKRFRVEPSLIKAVIKAESDFDYKAVSPKGAQGLMQLMPETAEELEVRDPFNPEDNIFGGARYLGWLLERFKHDKVMALAAYNAGPAKVKHYGGVPPFPETRSFIEKVLVYYREYRTGNK